MSNKVQAIKNYFFPVIETTGKQKAVAGNEKVVKNLRNYMAKVQFQRIRQDIKTWRDAIVEAEQAWFPFRVRMQRLFQDTILNGHVQACWERRSDLTLLRDFKICNEKGEEDEDLKKYFRNITTDATGKKVNTASWFDDFMQYSIDALGFGYSLISLGDLENDVFPNLTIIPRQNVSPDRKNVSSYVYATTGVHFLEEPYADWHIYVPTSTKLGVSDCGYGLFYSVAYYEIFLRNNMGYNADFIEMFNQPIRVGKTTKTEEDERAEFEGLLRDMGSNAYMLLDDGVDSVELIESKNTGTAWQSYENFEQRLEKKISKLILGHADALDSIPGKLGGGDGEQSPASQALNDKQVKDGVFVQNVVNNKLIPRMRNLGFPIPLDYHFEFVNDAEKEEFRRREDNSNKVTAEIAQTMKNAGLQMDPVYFQERTGITTTALQQPIENDKKPTDDTATTTE